MSASVSRTGSPAGPPVAESTGKRQGRTRPRSLTSATRLPGPSQDGPERDETIQPLRSVSFQAPIGRSRSGASAVAGAGTSPSGANAATNSPGCSSSRGSATSTPEQAIQRPSGETAGDPADPASRTTSRGDGRGRDRGSARPGRASTRAGRAPARRDRPDRRERPEVGVRARVGRVDDPASVGRPGDALRVRLLARQPARLRPLADRADPDGVPAIAVAHLVPAPVGPGDPARGDLAPLRLLAHDEPGLGGGGDVRDPPPVGRPLGLRHAVLGRPEHPRLAAVERLDHDGRRAIGVVGKGAQEGDAAAVGGDARPAVADGASRQCPGHGALAGRRAIREPDEVEVGAIRLAVDEAADDDGAAAVGQRVVLLEDDLAADEVGGRDRSGHDGRVDLPASGALAGPEGEPGSRASGCGPSSNPAIGGHRRARRNLPCVRPPDRRSQAPVSRGALRRTRRGAGQRPPAAPGCAATQERWRPTHSLVLRRPRSRSATSPCAERAHATTAAARHAPPYTGRHARRPAARRACAPV